MLSRVLLVAVLMFASGVGECAERRYLEVTSPGITVISAADEKKTRQIARQAIMFRAAIEQAFGVSLTTSIPTRIYALDRRDWAKYAEPRSGLAGYFISHPFGGTLLFDAEDKATGLSELIFHEYMHYILRTFWVGEVPAFVDEGLAEAFSTAQFRDGTVSLQPREEHLRYLRQHDWLPFERLLQMRRDDPMYLDHALAPGFYAQAWATMYFAAAGSPELRERLRTYIRELNGSVSHISAAERLIGQDTARANREIGAFVRRRERLPIALIDVSAVVPRREPQPRALTNRESTLELAELLLRMGDRPARARELFVSLRAPSSDHRTQLGLAWTHLQAREWTQASVLLEDVASATKMEPASSVSLGRGLYYLVSGSDPGATTLSSRQRQMLIRARAAFEAGVDTRSTRLDAISGFVLSSLALEDVGEEVLVLAEIGYRTAPKSSELAVAIAILHEMKGDPETARRYWQEASRIVHTGPMRSRILKALEERATPVAGP